VNCSRGYDVGIPGTYEDASPNSSCQLKSSAESTDSSGSILKSSTLSWVVEFYKSVLRVAMRVHQK